MSKKPSAANKTTRARKNTLKGNTPKGEATLHGKVVEPLTPSRKGVTKHDADNATDLNTKLAPKPNVGSKRLFWRRDTAKAPYSSVKNKKSRLTGAPNTGAQARGGVKDDLIRFKIIWFFALLFFSVLVARAAWLQIVNAEFYIAKGNELITSERTQKAYRGMITDRNNLPLAISAPLASVWFSPHDYARDYYEVKRKIANTTDNPESQQYYKEKLAAMDLTQLANVSGMSLERLQQAVAIKESIDLNNEAMVKAALPTGPGSYYLPLLNKVTPELADGVMALNFPAVHAKEEFRRYYPQPQPNAQLLGFMGYSAGDPESDYEGRAGIERQYETQLAGEDGKVLVLKDNRQNSIEELEQLKPVTPGKDVTLSIDSRLQYLLYKELEKAGRLQEARWSTGMVVDVHTGEVLALSTWPSFNNNNLNEMTGNNQRNRAVLDTFEPGSVMKPFTVAAALKSGKYMTNSLIDTNPGSIRVKGYTIRDHGNLGIINMATLIQKSSNVASTKIALSLPPDGISTVQKSFGLGSKTALNLPGEQAGMVPTPKEKETARRATISYGYGLEVTLAQLAQAYATLGAGGISHPLTLLKAEGQTPGTQVLDNKDAMAVVNMMETVTQPGGTAVRASIDGYRVAGKTGTSRRINPDGGYYSDQYRTVFAGLAPASNPRLAAVILVEDPQKDHYAGLVAAPVFKNVMQEALRLYNVPLDKPLEPVK